jgi:hypothetical protein
VAQTLLSVPALHLNGLLDHSQECLCHKIQGHVHTHPETALALKTRLTIFARCLLSTFFPQVLDSNTHFADIAKKLWLIANCYLLIAKLRPCRRFHHLAKSSFGLLPLHVQVTQQPRQVRHNQNVGGKDAPFDRRGMVR